MGLRNLVLSSRNEAALRIVRRNIPKEFSAHLDTEGILGRNSVRGVITVKNGNGVTMGSVEVWPFLYGKPEIFVTGREFESIAVAIAVDMSKEGKYLFDVKISGPGLTGQKEMQVTAPWVLP